jgi:uncharacterized protein (TIGR03792 family)
MVIEFLTFTVDPADRETWMSVEERTWSRFLERQPGFIDKQLWTDREHVDQVHAMIRWETEAHWHAIPHDELAAVDAEMGEWFRDCTMRVYDVLRDC